MTGDRRYLGLGIALISVGLVGVLALSLLWPRAVTIDDAVNIAVKYLATFGNPDLAGEEVMEFELNYYVIYYEKTSGVGAFEMLIDKSTGSIFPEYGPNMMWNTKYGHGGMMGRWRQPPTADMPVDREEAIQIAQDYLDRAYPGAEAEEAHGFYGYYTIHVTRQGRILGMLSVNGYDGVVWYHNWHGAYLNSREIS